MNRTPLALPATLFLAALLSAPALADPPPKMTMKPGSWQYTIEMELPGMPMKLPPQKFQHCLSKKDMDEGRAMHAQKEAGMNCDYRNVKVAGPRVQFSVACTMKDGGKMDADYDMTMNANDASGVIKMRMSQLPGGEATQRMVMQRTGDC